MNSIQTTTSTAKRAGEPSTRRRCVCIQLGGDRAVIAPLVVVQFGKRRPIRLVETPIGSLEIDGVLPVHRDFDIVLDGDHVVDEAADLVPAPDAGVAGAGVEGLGDGEARADDLGSPGRAPGDHVDRVGRRGRGHVQACQPVGFSV